MKKTKNFYKSNKSKIKLQSGMKDLNYLTDLNLYQVFKTISNISLKTRNCHC